jgi:hypothetical protein
MHNTSCATCVSACRDSSIQSDLFNSFTSYCSSASLPKQKYSCINRSQTSSLPQGHHGYGRQVDRYRSCRRKQSKRFQHARIAYELPNAHITAGHSWRQETKGSDAQITFNKATSLYKCRPKSQIDYRKTGDIISALPHVQSGVNNVKRSGNWKDTNFYAKHPFYAIISARAWVVFLQRCGTTSVSPPASSQVSHCVRRDAKYGGSCRQRYQDCTGTVQIYESTVQDRFGMVSGETTRTT